MIPSRAAAHLAVASTSTASCSRSVAAAVVRPSSVAKQLRQRAQQRIAYIDSEQPQRPSQASTSKPILPISHPATLTDSHSRHHSYLRISLTEKCSFRCTYCMPAEGVPLTPDDRLLSTQEVKRIARVFVQMGVKKIRLTGGEPTLRKDLVEIVRYLDSLRSEGLESIGLTTNGLVLSRMLPDLVAAGLTHVNISIDSLQPDRFASISRMSPKVLQKVLTTIDEALLYQPRLKVKLNVVVMKGMNDDEVNDFVELTRHRNLDVRFIEYMPFNSNAWSTEALLPAAELLQRVQAVHPVARHVDEANDTTRHYAVQGFAGRFGFISSMTDHFCASCNRVRVLADGNLKVCLFGNKEVSLRDALRTGHDDEALGSLISQALDRKHFKHAGMKDPKEIWEAAEGRGAGAAQRLFSTSSARRDDDTNPWAEIDESVDRLASDPPAEPDSSSGDASDLSAEERMLLQAFTAKLDHLDAKQRSRPPVSQAPNYSPAPRVHQPAPRPPPPVTRTTRPPPRLTHLDPATQQPRMVDVSSKSSTDRSATASGKVFLPFDVLPLLTGASSSSSEGDIASPSGKGPVFSTARLAGVLAAKRTDELVPLCHTLPLDGVDVQLELVIPPGREAEEMDADEDLPPRPHILITATCTTRGPTGVEMEALTAVSMAAVTVWDMLKSVAGREMEMGEIAVVAKSGGKSGDWVRTMG